MLEEQLQYNNCCCCITNLVCWVNNNFPQVYLGSAVTLLGVLHNVLPLAPIIMISSGCLKNNIKKLSQQQNKNKINCSRRCLEVFWNGTIVLHKWWSITLPSFSLVFPSRPCSDQAHFGILTACCPRWQKEYHQIQDLYPLLAGYLSKRFNELF